MSQDNYPIIDKLEDPTRRHLYYIFSSNLQYDHFVKDHLGNVRMLLTEQKDTSFYPPASMETAQATTEEALYSNVSETRTTPPSGYPTDTYTNPNDYVAGLDAGDNKKIGPGIVLRVMAGDKFNIRVSSWWHSTDPPGDPGDPSDELLTAMSNSVGAVTGSHGGPGSAQLISSGVLPGVIASFLSSQSYDDSKPAAYINWLLLDDQFNMVAASSGFEQVGVSDDLTIHTLNDLPVTQNGYLYIYTSNATKPIEVFFDNLQVTHIRGPLVSEDHYYPFGLTMNGISSKALAFGNPNNKYKYNGKEEQRQEFSDGSGLEAYDFKYRFYDMQLGLFHNQDRLADKYPYMSPYQFCSNNPIWLKEIDGLEGVKYNETDAEGHTQTVVEKNIVIMVEKKKDIPVGATKKEANKINKQNKRIESNNNARIGEIKGTLNDYYNGSDGKGVKDSKGNSVLFKFNVVGVPELNTKGMTQKDINSKYDDLSKLYSIPGTYLVNGVQNDISSKAGVLTNESSGFVAGLTTGKAIIRLGIEHSDGTIAHEVAHTLGLSDNDYISGGILNTPPAGVLPAEVDMILKQAYDKKK